MSFSDIDFDKIDRYLDLNQLGLNSTVFMHRQHDDNNETNAFIDDIKTISQWSGMPAANEAAMDTPGVPPSSAISFLAARPKLPTVVLTDHYREYANKYYHSRFDDSNYIYTNSKISSVKAPIPTPNLCNIATLVARILYISAGNFNASSPPPEVYSISADCDQVAELFYCITSDFSCDLVNQIMTDKYKVKKTTDGSPRTPTAYTSVYQVVKRERIDGPPRFYYQYLKTKVLNRSGTVFFHDAVDPLLSFNFDNGKFEPSSNVSSTYLWTESNWQQDIGTRSYVAEHHDVEYVMISCGAFILVISILVTHFSSKVCQKRYKLL